MALRGRKIEIFDDISLAAWSQGHLMLLFENWLMKHKWATLVNMQLEVYYHILNPSTPQSHLFRLHQYETPCTYKIHIRDKVKEAIDKILCMKDGFTWI